MRLLAFLCVLAASRSTAAPQQGANLIGNGTFDSGAAGWKPLARAGAGTAVWSAAGGRTGGGLKLVAGSDGLPSLSAWRREIEPAPAARSVKLSAWIRGSGIDGSAGALLQWTDRAGHLLAFISTTNVTRLRGTFTWTQVETEMPRPQNAARLSVLLMLQGSGMAWFDDVRLEAADSVQDAGERPQPGLFEVFGSFSVTAHRPQQAAELLIPLPMDYRTQAPVSFSLTAEPPHAVALWHIADLGRSCRALKLTLAALSTGQKVKISWKSQVLAGAESFEALPKSAPMPTAWPEEVRPWLAPTRCVECANPRIMAHARQARGSSRDVLEILHRTVAECGRIMQQVHGTTTVLTSVQALDHAGTCTSAANLMAALLRAEGVPARVLSGYPSWSPPLQTHYIVEAYVPGFGWYPIESSLLQMGWQRYEQIEVSIVAPEYENRCDARPFGMAGVPWLSVTECTNGGNDVEWGGTIDHDDNDHAVREVARYKESDAPLWAATLSAARARWEAWVTRPPDLWALPALDPPGRSDGLEALKDSLLGQP